jgi:hypothetical protein
MTHDSACFRNHAQRNLAPLQEGEHNHHVALIIRIDVYRGTNVTQVMPDRRHRHSRIENTKTGAAEMIEGGRTLVVSRSFKKVSTNTLGLQLLIPWSCSVGSNGLKALRAPPGKIYRL